MATSADILDALKMLRVELSAEIREQALSHQRYIQQCMVRLNALFDDLRSRLQGLSGHSGKTNQPPHLSFLEFSPSIPQSPSPSPSSPSPPPLPAPKTLPLTVSSDLSNPTNTTAAPSATVISSMHQISKPSISLLHPSSLIPMDSHLPLSQTLDPSKTTLMPSDSTINSSPSPDPSVYLPFNQSPTVQIYPSTRLSTSPPPLKSIIFSNSLFPIVPSTILSPDPFPLSHSSPDPLPLQTHHPPDPPSPDPPPDERDQDRVEPREASETSSEWKPGDVEEIDEGRTSTSHAQQHRQRHQQLVRDSGGGDVEKQEIGIVSSHTGTRSPPSRALIGTIHAIICGSIRELRIGSRENAGYCHVEPRASCKPETDVVSRHTRMASLLLTAYYEGMLQYDGWLKIPSRYRACPPEIQRTSEKYVDIPIDSGITFKLHSQMKVVEKVFEEMTERKGVLWNTMSGGLVELEFYMEPQGLFLVMWKEIPTAGPQMFASVIGGSVALGELVIGNHLRLYEQSYVSCAWIDMYNNGGHIQEVQWAFDEMLKKTILGWNIVITGYALHGDGKMTLEIYYKMQNSDVKMDQFHKSILFLDIQRTDIYSNHWVEFTLNAYATYGDEYFKQPRDWLDIIYEINTPDYRAVMGEKDQLVRGDVIVVPPKASLFIILELISWKTTHEVGDTKKLLNRVLKEGEDYECPNEGVVVRVKVVGKEEEGLLFVQKEHAGEQLLQLIEFQLDCVVGSGITRKIIVVQAQDVARRLEKVYDAGEPGFQSMSFQPSELPSYAISTTSRLSLLAVAVLVAKTDIKHGEDPWLYKLYEFLETRGTYHSNPQRQSDLQESCIVINTATIESTGASQLFDANLAILHAADPTGRFLINQDQAIKEMWLRLIELEVPTHWLGWPPSDTTWSSLKSFCRQCPTLHLEVKVDLKGKRIDTTLPAGRMGVVWVRA